MQQINDNHVINKMICKYVCDFRNSKGSKGSS